MTVEVIKFNSKSYERLIEEGKTLKEFLNDPNSLINNPRYFKLEDFDGDGLEELCSMSNLMFESLGRMSMGIEYTFYKAANNTVKPAKIIVVLHTRMVTRVYLWKIHYGSYLIIFYLLLRWRNKRFLV